MMYINIKKLQSWRIRPYKIPSFFFSLLFPFFSLFSSLFFFPPSSPLFRFFPPHGVQVCPSFGAVGREVVQRSEGCKFNSLLKCPLARHFFLFFFPFFTLLSFFYSSFQNCEEYTFSPGFAIFGGIRIAACSYIFIFVV